MKYLSICSGIEAASVAWHPLGWTPVAFAEIEAFPSAVLQHHYPSVPNWGDITTFKDWPDAAIDLLVGGTPCQSFSVAGLRKGLADPRGNLALTYLAIADRYRPEWLVWENVPGVLSSGNGRDFGAFLGGLVELGYGWAYRVLDAQYFGLAQRRKRVFVVASARGWQRAAAVLFDGASLRGDSAPRRQSWEKPAPTLGAGPVSGGRKYGTDADSADSLIAIQGAGSRSLGPNMNGCGISKEGVMYTLNSAEEHAIAFSAKDHGADAGELAPTLRSGGHDKSHANGGVMPAVAFDARQSDVIQYGEKTGPLDTCGFTMGIAFAENQRAELTTSDTAGSLKVGGGKPGQGYPAVQTGMQVRRLTPRECERLQGFPDDYTLIPYRGKPASDGPRYKALGNSMAVPCMAWIGRRLQMVVELAQSEEVA